MKLPKPSDSTTHRTDPQSQGAPVATSSPHLAQIDEALASLKSKTESLDVDFISTTLSNARTAVADSLQRTTAAEQVPVLREQLSDLSSRVSARTAELSAAQSALATFETLSQNIKSGLLGKIELAYPKELRAGYAAKVTECKSPQELVQLSLEITLAFNAAWASSQKPSQFEDAAVIKHTIPDPSIFSIRSK